ncbi:IS66 family transposase [Pullulanibacillus sp. KACC 23026]|uniref:IS66 family transposase n=1 Tax=Pullulanibacillus sp. KACC 23026 TaxID=3028315 RepID=UPI0023AE760C|nr:IS66 family transposase [Pullulanibacillus sp. KACC 23026]WEG13656.1 IS66 family transposase [Pullulanibacillus sp. KACC 23026]
MKPTKTSATILTTEQLQARCAFLENQVAELSGKLQWLESQVRLGQHKRFGSSEKTHPDQLELPLFNEAEVEATSQKGEPATEIITFRRKKQRGQREVLLDNLPTETVEYRLSPDDQVPMPKPVYPGSLASPSSLAYIMNQKYVEGCPLYRLEKQFERFGFSLSRQTMSNWILFGANQWLKPLYQQMKAILIQKDVLHADESTLQVLHEPGRKATSKSYMWVYRSGRTSEPIILFDYQETRQKEHPARFLKGFKGYLHVDGYQGCHLGGMLGALSENLDKAHARRKFTEALKALPETASTSIVKATEGLAFCNHLFKIERDLKDVSPEERYEERLKRSQPVLEAFSAWLREQTPKVLPKSALGQAVKYCRNQWDRLVEFLSDGRLEIDNNRGERSIKPFVIGRKNWLFSNTAKGAKSSAIIYSIVETAKENGLSPFHYLSYLFKELPNIDTTDKDKLADLLPWSSSIPIECRVPIKSK